VAVSVSDHFALRLFLWTVAAAVSVAIGASSISARGSEAREHGGPVPAGVIEYTPRHYVIPDGLNVVPERICRGTDRSVSTDRPVRTVARVPREKQTFVECARSQLWNRRIMRSPTFWQGALDVVRDRRWEIPFGVLLPFVFPWLMWWHERRDEREEARRAAEKQDALRAALAAAYARGEINEVEFDQSLDRVMRGLEPEAKAKKALAAHTPEDAL
jgi:hypothetical protein